MNKKQLEMNNISKVSKVIKIKKNLNRKEISLEDKLKFLFLSDINE